MQFKPKTRRILKVGGKVVGTLIVAGVAYYLMSDKPLNNRERKNVSEYLTSVCSTAEFKEKFPPLAIYEPKPGEHPVYLRPLPPAIFALTDVSHRQTWDTSTVSAKFIDSLTNYLNRNIRERFPGIKMKKPSLSPHFILDKKGNLVGRGGYRFYKAKKAGPFSKGINWARQKITRK